MYPHVYTRTYHACVCVCKCLCIFTLPGFFIRHLPGKFPVHAAAPSAPQLIRDTLVLVRCSYILSLSLFLSLPLSYIAKKSAAKKSFFSLIALLSENQPETAWALEHCVVHFLAKDTEGSQRGLFQVSAEVATRSSSRSRFRRDTETAVDNQTYDWRKGRRLILGKPSMFLYAHVVLPPGFALVL